MRPTGIVLIAFYHYLSAAFLLLLAILLFGGGHMLGDLLGLEVPGINFNPENLAWFVGMLAAAVPLVFAAIAAAAGYGIWNFREWGRILCIALAGITVVLSLRGLLRTGYHLIELAINILIIWYLVRPHTRALFQQTRGALP